MTRLLGTVSALFFCATAAVGVWVAYDLSGAQVKLLLILIGLILAVGIAWRGPEHLETSLAAVSLASCLAVVGLCFSLVLFQTASGPAANALVILLTLATGAAVPEVRRRFRLSALMTGCSLIFGIIGLMLTRERTPWISLGLGLFAGGVVHWRFVRSHAGRVFKWSDGVFPGVALLVLVCATLPCLFTSSGSMGDIRSLTGRLTLWYDSLALVQDYFFTGSGLSNTAMVFSSYVVLLHVPFQSQTHNLFLQIATEQGMPGLVSFLGMVVASIWSLQQALRIGSAPVRQAATVTSSALTGLLVYGLIDSEIYISDLTPVLYIPFGVAWLLGGVASVECPHATARFTTQSKLAVTAAALSLCVCCSVLLLPAVRAQLLANLGAVSQSQAELSAYAWPKWGLQDEVRRSGAVDLSKTISSYRSALSLDPRNVTANRRLGQIMLAKGDVRSAMQHLEVAYANAPGQRATCQLLGEVYAISGNIEKAVDLWQTIDTSHRQLEVRQWWYESIQAERESSLLTAAIDALRKRQQLSTAVLPNDSMLQRCERGFRW